MSEHCDRCGHEITEADFAREHSTIHVATCGETDRPFELGNGETLPAGSFYHGDSWHQLCPECSADWRQWFALFMAEGEGMAMYGRQS